MTDKLKVARRIRKNLRRIGVASAITVKDDMIVVSGKDREGELFAVRIGRCADMDGVDAFAAACDRLRTYPRQPGDLILVPR
jgi:hypothetical protein